MKQTEITVQVFDEKDEIINKLKNKNFVFVENVLWSDWYFSKYDSETLKTMKYSDIMKNSFLVRKCNEDQKIIYKNKEVNDNDEVVSEEKISLEIADCENAVNVFKSAGLNNWCKLVQDMYIYKNDEIEIAVQCIDDFGIFIEYEEDDSVSHLETNEKIQAMINKLKSIGLNIGSDFSVKKVYEKFTKQ